MNLTLRRKIATLPAVALAGSALILAVLLIMGRQVERDLRLIESGYTPSVELSRTLEESLGDLQRALQDAVAASDLFALEGADTIAAQFRGSLKAGADNALIADELEGLNRRFDSYYSLARRTTSVMIEGTATDLLPSLQRMTAEFNGLRTTLHERTERDRARAAEAFQHTRDRQERTVSVVVGVLLAVTSVLLLVSVRIVKSIATGLDVITEAATRIARGDVDQTVEYHSSDELGRQADAFRSLIAYVKDVSNSVEGLAAGRLDVRLEPRSDRDLLSANVARAQQAMRALVAEVTTLTGAAREGQLAKRGNATAFEGAYQELVAGVNATLDAVVAPVEEATRVLERLAERDLTARVQGEYLGDHARIKEAMNRAVANLEEVLGEVWEATEEITGASEQIGDGSRRLAEGASEQASALEEVSGSLQELSSMAKQNVGNAKEAQSLAECARASATQGVDRMNALTSAMEKIKASSDATARIVRTIDEIAFQTNLLALNAAVEAARAGDAGKGFAVVAEEVRSLAQRSAEAARNTSRLIEESVKNAESGVELNGAVLKQLGEIAGQVNRVGAVMGEIAAASEQQSDGVSQINSAVEQMNGVTQGVASNSEQSAASAEELSGQAERMRELVTTFRLQGVSGKAKAHVVSLVKPEAGARKPNGKPATQARERWTGTTR
jgi:methyl-accepting chemotaxis protein